MKFIKLIICFMLIGCAHHNSNGQYSFGQKLACGMRHMKDNQLTIINQQLKESNDISMCISQGKKAIRIYGACPAEHWIICSY